MRHRHLPARILPLVRLVGPYGWMAAGLVAGALLARNYLRRTRAFRATLQDDHAVAQWEGEGGAWGRS